MIRTKVATNYEIIDPAFRNFFMQCQTIALQNNWHHNTVMNYQLKPHGRLVRTMTQGWYIRWDNIKYHNLFLLKYA